MTEVVITREPTGAHDPNAKADPASATDQNKAPEKKEGEQTSPPNIPEYVPEKFRTAADPMKAMADALAAAEKKITEQGQEKPKPEDKPKDGETPKAEGDTPPGLTKYFEEFDKDGKLSDASYADLDKLGINRETVDAYIAGLDAMAAKSGQELVSVVGGDEGYKALIEWGAKNLSEAEQDSYDAALGKGDLATAKALLSGFNARMVAERGQDPTRVVTGTRAEGPSQGFASMQEQIKAQTDPRYGKDPAYTAEVERKAMKSTF